MVGESSSTKNLPGAWTFLSSFACRSTTIAELGVALRFAFLGGPHDEATWTVVVVVVVSTTTVDVVAVVIDILVDELVDVLVEV